MFIGLLSAFLVVIADQVSKIMIFDYLSHTERMLEITPWFNLVTAWNTGVSFSMFNDLGGWGVYILSLFSLTVVGILFYWLLKEKVRMLQLALGFVIGGALGNVIDRIRIGAVFDFLDVHIGGHHWPAFNVADSFICIGAFLLVCHGLFAKNCGCQKLKSVDKEIK